LPPLADYQSGTCLPPYNRFFISRGYPQRKNPDSIAIVKHEAEPLPQRAGICQCKVQVKVCVLDGADMMAKTALPPRLSTHDRRQREAGRRRYSCTIG